MQEASKDEMLVKEVDEKALESGVGGPQLAPTIRTSSLSNS